MMELWNGNSLQAAPLCAEGTVVQGEKYRITVTLR